jgi:hypothetical protein
VQRGVRMSVALSFQRASALSSHSSLPCFPQTWLVGAFAQEIIASTCNSVQRIQYVSSHAKTKKVERCFQKMDAGSITFAFRGGKSLVSSCKEFIHFGIQLFVVAAVALCVGVLICKRKVFGRSAP